MSIGVLHGQTGGAGLAVKVVGGTQKPSNAKQGVIWVNTDQKITSWTIQAEEPAEPNEGMVWVCINTDTKLNALKKNGIWFTPTSAKQYLDGGWVKKTAEYYNNGQWVAFFEATIHITYPAGSLCTATDGETTLTAPDTSGTWDCVVANAGEWTVALDSGFSEVVSATENGGTYTVDKWYLFRDGDQYTHITGGYFNLSNATFSNVIKLSPGNTGVTSYGTAVTNNKIPISGFKTMYFVMNRIIVPTVNGLYAMGLSQDNTTVDHNKYTAVVKKTGASNVSNVVLSLNISNASSNYVKVHVQDYNSTSYAEISKIYVMP